MTQLGLQRRVHGAPSQEEGPEEVSQSQCGMLVCPGPQHLSMGLNWGHELELLTMKEELVRWKSEYRSWDHGFTNHWLKSLCLLISSLSCKAYGSLWGNQSFVKPDTLPLLRSTRSLVYARFYLVISTSISSREPGAVFTGQLCHPWLCQSPGYKKHLSTWVLIVTFFLQWPICWNTLGKKMKGQKEEKKK